MLLGHFAAPVVTMRDMKDLKDVDPKSDTYFGLQIVSGWIMIGMLILTILAALGVAADNVMNSRPVHRNAKKIILAFPVIAPMFLVLSWKYSVHSSGSPPEVLADSLPGLYIWYIVRGAFFPFILGIYSCSAFLLIQRCWDSGVSEKE